MLTSHRALILFLLVAGTFLIAHTINAVIAEALFTPPSAIRSIRGDYEDKAVTRSPSLLAEQIRKSGLFTLPADPLGLIDGTGSTASETRQPLNLGSKIRLLGVVMSDRGGISAIIEELSSKRQLFLRLHEQIPGIGEISEIRREGIVVRQGEQEELLEMLTGEFGKSSGPQVASVGASAPRTGGPIRKVLDRREVEQAMNDLPRLLSQARAVPFFVNGTMNGFRLDYIAPASFYEKIGLRYGDVLKQVNGVEIKDPSTMLSLFQQLRNEQSVKVNVLRNNQPTTMTFDIR